MKNKILIIALSLFNLNNVFASEYLVTLDNKHYSNSIIVAPLVTIPSENIVYPKCASGAERVDITKLKEMITNNDIGLETVCTEGINDMSSLFAGKLSFNQDISGWDVSNVTNMTSMFQFAREFNQDISGWDVSNVATMKDMFYDARKFNQDIKSWNVSTVTNMQGMFDGALVFSQDIGGWDVSNVTTMYAMFSGAVNFNDNLSNWDVSSVLIMTQMFYLISDLDQDLSGWDVSNVYQHGDFTSSGAMNSSKLPNF